MAASANISQIQKELPLELIPFILSNLGKVDLLNCRLVCKTWNSECLKILSTSDWKIRLNHFNRDDYVKFLKESVSPKLVVPIQLAFQIYSNENPWVKAVNSLYGLLGENCIQSFVVTFCFCKECRDYKKYESEGNEEKFEVSGFKDLMKMLNLVSSSLMELNLNELSKHVKLELPPKFMAAITKHIGNTSFPNLQSFTAQDDEGPKEGTFVPRLLNHIMENSPILKTLRVGMPTSIYDWSYPFGTLETLALSNFKPSTQFLQKIQQFSPRLRKFEIPKSKIQTGSEGMLFISILTSISSTLESLEFSVDTIVSLTFPVMKKLKHLKSDAHFETINRMNFDSTSFPNLETLDIRMDLEDEMEETIFPNPKERLPNFPHLRKVTIHSPSNDVVWTWNLNPFFEKMKFPLEFFYSEQSTEFQTVTEVELNCYSRVVEEQDEPDEFMDDSVEENIKNIKVLFPALTKLSLEYPKYKEDTIGSKGEYYFIRLLKMFLESLDDTKLKEITLMNLTSNSLGKAINEMLHPPRIILENLEAYPGLADHVAEAWQDYTRGLEKIGKSSEGRAKSSNSKNAAAAVLQNLSGRDRRSLKVFKGVERIRMVKNKGWRTYNKLESNVDFTLMARHFPNLRELIIPAYWFNRDEKKCLEQIQNIQQLFHPDLIIERSTNNRNN